MADGLEQVRFPHAGLPVQEKGIEQGPFRLGDGQPCLIGKAAVFINYERIERVQIIQACPGSLAALFLCRGGRGIRRRRRFGAGGSLLWLAFGGRQGCHLVRADELHLALRAQGQHGGLLQLRRIAVLHPEGGHGIVTHQRQRLSGILQEGKLGKPQSIHLRRHDCLQGSRDPGPGG